MKVETVLLAGICKWGIMVDGKLDCDIPLSNSEESARELGDEKYDEFIVTTCDPEHYSNS